MDKQTSLDRIHTAIKEKSIESYQKFEGADLIPIRELMDGLTDRQPKWGGLTRRQTPEGDILWLCKEHLREYENRRKMVYPQY